MELTLVFVLELAISLQSHNECLGKGRHRTPETCLTKAHKAAWTGGEFTQGGLRWNGENCFGKGNSMCKESVQSTGN